MSLEDGTADGGVLDFSHPCDSSKLKFLVVSFSFGRWHRGGGFLDFCHLMDSFIGFLDFGSRHSFVEQT